jgi:hypothetical protein
VDEIAQSYWNAKEISRQAAGEMDAYENDRFVSVLARIFWGRSCPDFNVNTEAVFEDSLSKQARYKQ